MSEWPIEYIFIAFNQNVDVKKIREEIYVPMDYIFLGEKRFQEISFYLTPQQRSSILSNLQQSFDIIVKEQKCFIVICIENKSSYDY